jgi:hypothetical protein
LQEPEKVQGKKNFSIAGKPLFSADHSQTCNKLDELKENKETDLFPCNAPDSENRNDPSDHLASSFQEEECSALPGASRPGETFRVRPVNRQEAWV